MVIYSSREETFVIDNSDKASEEAFLAEYFEKGTGRDREDYDRLVTSSPIVQVHSRLVVET